MSSNERIVSPGVFTQENDLSFIQRGIAEIGAAVVGRTPTGPAFQPTVVDSFDEFTTVFGGKDKEYQVPYMADEYLRNSNKLTVTRVLGGGAFTYSKAIEILSGSVLLAVIRPTHLAEGTVYGWITGSTTEVSMSSFDLILSESNGETTYSGVSLTPTDANYIGSQLGTNPKIATGTNYFYLDHVYTNTISSSLADYNGLLATGSIDSSTSAAITTDGYSTAETPIVISQLFGASTYHSLFTLKTLTDGTGGNKTIKAGVFAARESGSIPGSHYGDFGIVVRQYNDTDANPIILETFNGLNLDESSPNYVAKRIGDQRKVTDSNGKITIYGEYPNLSKYVRVVMEDLGTVPTKAIPFGFKNMKKYNSSTPDVSYQYSQSINNDYNKKAYFGVDFTRTDVGNYHSPLPTNKANMSTAFYLESCVSQSSGLFGGSLSVSSSILEKQFMFGFTNGFDGYNPRLIVASQSVFTTSTSSGSIEFKKGVDSVKNPDEYDFNMLIIPECEYRNHSYILDYALSVCEDRGDALMIMDMGPKTDSIATITSTAKSIDSSYGATYFPWIKIFDEASNKNIWVPPSVVLPGILAYSDKVSHEWFAPAGLNRGGLTRVLQAYLRLDRDDRDDLYNGRINPIATFPDTGVSVWGQKTLQAKDTLLTRINVRRLMLKIKKTIASMSRYLTFEQNNEITWDKFKNAVNPILEEIKLNQGLNRYLVVMDETTNTPDVRDRNEMRGEVYLWPTSAVEFVILSFNVLSTGGAAFG